jgi:hypothetical protein
MALILYIASIPVAMRIIAFYLQGFAGERPIFHSIMFMFLFVSATQSLLFAMWMDMQDNQHLYRR